MLTHVPRRSDQTRHVLRSTLPSLTRREIAVEYLRCSFDECSTPTKRRQQHSKLTVVWGAV